MIRSMTSLINSSENTLALPILPKVYFDYPCPACGRARNSNGLWFRSIRTFVCEGCGATVTITYEDKQRLFAAYEEKHKLLEEKTLPSTRTSRPRS
jgi:hypothetical protein